MANKGELVLGQEVTLPESADELVEFAERLAHRALQSERAEASRARAELETEKAGRERAQRERDALVEEVKRLHDENAELLSVRERVMQTLSSVQHPSSANSSDTSSRRPSAREFNCTRSTPSDTGFQEAGAPLALEQILSSGNAPALSLPLHYPPVFMLFSSPLDHLCVHPLRSSENDEFPAAVTLQCAQLLMSG